MTNISESQIEKKQCLEMEKDRIGTNMRFTQRDETRDSKVSLIIARGIL